MSIVKMSIHRALPEKKTYDARILNATAVSFIISNKASNKKIGSKTIAEATSAIESNFKSVTALMENKKRIAAVIVSSNATTEVSIGGMTYKIAEAIERKQLIKLEENLLSTLKRQYTDAKAKADYENNLLPGKLEEYLKSILGGDKAQRSAEEVALHTTDFMAKNTYDLIDPLKLEDEIKKLEKDILDFKTNVDYVLSESNATTFVEVEFID